jgi:hypothetical protein
VRPLPEGAHHEEFDGEATTCTVLPDRARAVGAAQADHDRDAHPDRPRPPATPPPGRAGRARPLLGSVGSGDLEVRERRARRAAADALAESHPEEFAALLRDARAAEGLRPLGNDATADAAPADGGTAPDGD